MQICIVADGQVHLKLLIPSIAAGAVIGKGGETISHMQKEYDAAIKMSKSQDLYPGTNERICLILGSLESVTNVAKFIWEKIRSKPDARQPMDSDGGKMYPERHKQVQGVL